MKSYICQIVNLLEIPMCNVTAFNCLSFQFLIQKMQEWQCKMYKGHDRIKANAQNVIGYVPLLCMFEPYILRFCSILLEGFVHL